MDVARQRPQFCFPFDDSYRLALPEAEWWPFDRSGPWRHFYPKRESKESAANGPQVLPTAA